MTRLWGTALLSVAVAAAAIHPLLPAHAQAETGLRLPVEIRAVGRVALRIPLLPPVPPGGSLGTFTVAESEKKLTGTLAGMTVTGSMSMKWDADPQRRETRMSIRGAELATPVGSLRLEFVQSGGENNFVIEAAGATGAFSGLAVRGMVTAKDLDKEQSFFSGFLVVAGDRQSPVARFGEAAAIASAPVGLVPFPLAAMQMALQTAARLRVWEEPGGVLFEMYLLVGAAGDQGRKQKVVSTAARIS
jgi:hypothetical protein